MTIPTHTPNLSATPRSSNEDARSLQSSNKPAATRLLPHDHQINTSVALAITTPTSASTRSSPSIDSFAMDTNTSNHTSPEALNGFSLSDFDGIPPLLLPKSPVSTVTPTSPPMAMAEAQALAKGAGLIRRISRGARNNLSLRRGSAQATHRDQSSGPAIMRRRSDSRNLADASMDISDLELEREDETPPAFRASHLRNGPRTQGRQNSTTSPEREDGLAFPTALKLETTLVKVTKRKRKHLSFRLDTESAKIVWSNASSSKKQLYIDDVHDVRMSTEARTHRRMLQVPDDLEDRWLSIIYADPDKSKGRSTKSMHLIAPTPATCIQWTRTIEFIRWRRENLMAGVAGNGEESEQAQWRHIMTRRNGSNPQATQDERMSYAELKQTCRNFHIYMSDKILRPKFEAADQDGSGDLDFNEYTNFFRQLKDRKDLRRLYDSIKPVGNELLSREDFIAFIRSSQVKNLQGNEQYWEDVFDYYITQTDQHSKDQESINDTTGYMDFKVFSVFMISPQTAPLIPRERSEPKLTHPLNEYYISSSHNTYLMGRQFAGESSTEGYVKALKKGCRCVEIDCWDGVDGTPDVVHGHTGTSRIKFIDCINTINRYAFYSSEYPLILSLEVHCNPQQQAIMAEMMKGQFGSQLITKPIMSNVIALPSPEELRNRILIKVKEPKDGDNTPLGSSLTAPSSHRRQRSVSAPDARAARAAASLHMTPTFSGLGVTPQRPVNRSSTVNGPSGSGIISANGSDESDATFDDSILSDKRKKGAQSNIVKPLGELGVYSRGIKFSDFKSLKSRTFNHVYSFKEATFDAKCRDRDTKALLEKHNMRYLMRVYPNPAIRSDNFEPIKFWRRGVQMVATNWQTHDLGTEINDAMFAAPRDLTGYVLKPKDLRLSKDGLNSDETMPVKSRKKRVRFSVDIISAQHLVLPPNSRVDPASGLNPYVEFEVHIAEDKAKGNATSEGGTDASARPGLSGIGSPVRKRTKVVDGNGYNPAFHESISMTLETKYPELVFVRWVVCHSNDGRTSNSPTMQLGTYTAKLGSLAQGYRHLPLISAGGDSTLSTLFVNIKREEDIDIAPFATGENPLELFRSSEDSPRSILRKVFRTNSERRRNDDEKSLRHTYSTEK